MIPKSFSPLEKRKMIIPELKRALYLMLLMTSLVAIRLEAQELQPAASFHLQNPGYGAAALGIGGAFVAVASDLTTIYWNPAGLAQLNGWHVFADYRYQGDSDEDIGAEVLPNRFEQKQRFALSGNQFQAAGLSYSFTSGNFAIVPGFAWQRTSAVGPVRELKEATGVVEFPSNQFFFQSEGTFTQEIDGAEEEFAFGVAARASNRILFGGSWSFLRGGPEEKVTGNFHDTLNLLRQEVRTDVALDQTRTEELSGNYLKLGLIVYPANAISMGGYVRFPYTRSSTISLQRTGPFDTNRKFLDESGNVIREENESGTLQQSATAESEVEIPMEWSAGIALRPRRSFLVAGSITYADWADAELAITNSSDPALIAETTLPYPTLRVDAAPQPALLQWRGGIEYLMGQQVNGIFLRTGIFRDGQPYSTADGERVYFKGYTFGAGYVTRSFRFDVAYVRETGDITFTPNDREASRFKNRRWVLTVSLIS
jgi:hypothetical protein